MKKVLVLMLALMMTVTLFAGCQSSSDTEGDAATGDTLKVALLLPGTANDKGWNNEAYDGLMEIEELGCEVAYSEAVAASDYETVFRGYADQGYNIIFGHGSEFADAAKNVAPDYLDTMFLITSSDVVQEPNVAGVLNLNDQQGFIAGVVAALATETGKVGAIGGMEIPSIQSYITGFEQGVAYVDNGTVALTAFTGDFDDAAKLKDQAVVFIEDGADIIAHDADQAGLGVFEAVKGHEGVYAIGAVKDQYEENPEQTLTSATNQISLGMVAAVKEAMNGPLEAKVYHFGIAEGVIGLAPYHDCEDVLTDDEKQFVTDTMDKIAAGEIEIESAQAN
ncbi:BMP family protein [Eubacteriaceae bacterium ES3]|nr:BMP family protein [Eubacteriaceae bacterium ES3]